MEITGNSQTFRRMEEDMDFDASRILTGERTIAEAATELLSLVVETASCQPGKPERLGHREYFLTYKHRDHPLTHRRFPSLKPD